MVPGISFWDQRIRLNEKGREIRREHALFSRPFQDKRCSNQGARRALKSLGLPYLGRF